jgi:hypothetical protein
MEVTHNKVHEFHENLVNHIANFGSFTADTLDDLSRIMGDTLSNFIVQREITVQSVKEALNALKKRNYGDLKEILVSLLANQ